MFVSDANSTEISRSLYDQLIKRFKQAIVGKAFVANALTDMIDTSMIYVYVGETTSTLTYGDWYYHNGSATVATITLPTEYNETHSIDISSHCDTAGKYTVHLTNGTNDSDPTHFEVIDTTTTVSGAMATENDMLTVTFNKNARPMYVELSNVPGGQRGLRPLTEKEIKAGTVTFNAYDYIASTTGYNYPTGNCIRVKYRGDYGNVTSVLLPVETE